MKPLIWILCAVLLALWTGCIWVSTELFRWTVDLLSEGVKAASLLDLMSNWSIPSWLLLWVDAQQIQAVQLALVTWAGYLQGVWPGLGQAVSWIEPLVWGVWALGVLVLLLVAVGLHTLAARPSGPQRPAQRSPVV
jgi:hypothetical protein